MEPKIKIQDFTYFLPEVKIAKYPLTNRDDSTILIFRDNLISESKFSNLAQQIPDNSFMVFNNTKVVPARLFFKKSSGAHIEVFCIEPHTPSDYARSFETTHNCIWTCVIGNSKKWKDEDVFFDASGHSELLKYNLKANRVENNGETSIVKFTWDGGLSFAQIMELCGKVPIPPYLNRESEESDTERYQTLYAKIRGSVAAPTAGLHFTDSVLKALDDKGIIREELSLHVGTGTFKPVKTEFIKDHPMHSEPFSVTLSFLKALKDSIGRRCVIAVGTTSARTLESLYYIGIKCIEGVSPLDVEQWEPYNRTYSQSSFDSINALCNWMESNKIKILECRTRIIIVPGYKFRLVDALITNFHQPASTLLLLIAAFIGDRWRDVYNYALDNNFRFLSYGDSSLLFKK
ncbi:MAG: S-adenosylmethionine:tRNA ribosyltransferase-isomerase [Bacteroidales bacterium]|nr:S-adenosylmethionine:tRNA ribosyltransferase-isomerase [Bacteroidales bacterium]